MIHSLPRPTVLLLCSCAALSATVSVTAAEPSMAQENAVSQTQVGGEQDKGFVVKASQAGRQEIADAKIAQTKSPRADVKQVAAMLERDHAEAGVKLSTIVAKNHWNIPEASAMAKSSSADSAYSDEHYVSAQIAAHQEAIALFKTEAATGLDPELKAFAAETLPKLQHHLSSIQSLQKS